MIKPDPNKMAAENLKLLVNACQTCVHRSQVLHNICTAFPDGIPAEILEGRNDHKKPFAGDGGIVYSKKKA